MGIQLDNAYLREADLKQVWMPQVSLRKATLYGADLSKANLIGADLRKAKFHDSVLIRADLSGANLSGATLEEALTLVDTNLRGAKGLDEEQKAICKAKGAIIDEVPTTSSPWSIASPPPPSQSNDSHASSASPAQGILPTPDAGESSAASSQQDSES